DLRHMGSGGDVDEVVLLIRAPVIASGETPQRTVNILEVPGIAELDVPTAHFGLRRHLADIGGDSLGQPVEAPLMQHVKAGNREVVLHVQPHRRAPAIPALGLMSGIEGRAEEADGDQGAGHACDYERVFSLLSEYFSAKAGIHSPSITSNHI